MLVQCKIIFAFCVVGALVAVITMFDACGYLEGFSSERIPRLKPYYRSSFTPKVKRKPFAGVLLAVNFNHPFYSIIPLLKKYYEPLFERVIFCGPERSENFTVAVIEGTRGHFGYMCIVEGIKLAENFQGYLYLNDDMVVNWWSFVNQPRDHIWYMNIDTEAGAHMDKPPPCCWHWWTTAKALENCRNAFDYLNSSSSIWNGEKYLDIYFNNTGGSRLCFRAWSDLLYIPHRLSHTFQYLSEVFYKKNVFLEVAVSTIVMMLDKSETRVDLNGVYLPDLFGDVDFSDGSKFVGIYDTRRTFYHPVKLSVQGMALDLFNHVTMKKSFQCLQNFSSLSVDQ